MKPRVIDLFAGVGGLSLGFEMAGFNIVLANEYDESIAEAFKLNHPSTKMIVSDIRHLPIEQTFSEYRDKIDVIIGGPPCQGFSQKGQRKTIDDERNFLFKYFVAVVEYLRPLYFVMENVPNLLTAENGYFKNELIQLFAQRGYSVVSDTLNASDYGVPQNRRRAVIIGKLGNKPLQMPSKIRNRVSIWDAISDLAYHESGEGSDFEEYKNLPESDYQKDLRAGSNFLYNHKSTSHSLLALERLKLIPPNRGKEV